MIYLLSYAVFCVILAADNANRIKEGKKIHHGINGAIHIIVAVIGGFLFRWQIAVCVLLTARIVFDIALSLFRGLPPFYVSLNPKSVVDKIEKFIFKSNGWLPKLIYLAILVTLLLL